MKPISSTIHAEGDNASSICDNRKQPAKFILNNKLNSKYEQFKLRQITATIADNIGFTSASSTSINSLTFLMQSYFQHLCHESSEVANHAGRDFVTLDDASKVFSEQDINLVELHDYINQVENFGFQNQLPLFPVPFTISDTSTEMHPQSEKQQLVEAVTETDHNNKIELDNEKRTKASDKGEQRTNIRLTQRTFPKFVDAFAQDLGITVQKVVPPEVHIEDEVDFTRTLQHFATSFTIMSKLTNLVGPSLSVKAISQEVRHKSKKRKRERDIGKKDPQPYKKHRSKEEKRRNKESKRTDPVQDSQGTSVGVLPKVPKIKIRFGPGPSQNEQKTSKAYSEPMDDSPSLAAAPDKEIVKEEDQIKEATTTSSSLPAPRMEKSPEKQTHQLVPPLRIMKSPPKPGPAPLKVSAIADPDPQSLSSVGIKPNVEFIISQPKEKPESISGNLHDTQIDELELSRQSPITPIREKSSTLPVVKLQSKKRTRKSEKPTWMDPSLFSTLESSPPGISPAPSKALESIVPVETTNKVQTVNPQKGGNKPPEPILTEKKNVKSGAGHTKSAAMIHQTKTGTVETPKPPKEKEIKTKSDGKATSETSSKQLPSISQQPADGDGIDQEEEDIWICPVCSVAYVENGPAMVACDQCDRWFHWACVGILIEPPDNAPWFCTECKRKRKKQQQSGNGSSSGNAAHQPKKKQR